MSRSAFPLRSTGRRAVAGRGSFPHAAAGCAPRPERWSATATPMCGGERRERDEARRGGTEPCRESHGTVDVKNSGRVTAPEAAAILTDAPVGVHTAEAEVEGAGERSLDHTAVG